MPVSGRPTVKSPRLPALDVMRGLVMILMTVDHASHIFNRGRVFGDSGASWTPGTPLPVAQFLTRWITHLCAPTFVLLAGTALALSTDARERRGDSATTIDRHIAARGALLVALEVAWMSPAFVRPGHVLLQVLYAIGGALLCMVPLRRLSNHALLVCGVALALLDEPAMKLLALVHLDRSLLVALLLGGGTFARGRLIVGYPLLPWLGILCMGWVLGRKLVVLPPDERARVAGRTLAAWGAGLLIVFGIVRGINGFGNMGLLREGDSLVQWLHVSKYPPSVSFMGLELGIAATMLAALFLVVQRWPDFASPVQTLGKVALFYYVLHVHVMMVAGKLAGVLDKLDLTAAYVGALATVAVLFPLCVLYRRYKVAHPGGWTQYV